MNPALADPGECADADSTAPASGAPDDFEKRKSTESEKCQACRFRYGRECYELTRESEVEIEPETGNDRFDGHGDGQCELEQLADDFDLAGVNGNICVANAGHVEGFKIEARNDKGKLPRQDVEVEIIGSERSERVRRSYARARRP